MEKDNPFIEALRQGEEISRQLSDIKFMMAAGRTRRWTIIAQCAMIVITLIAVVVILGA